MDKTILSFDNIIENCRILFIKKINDYGMSWCILRPSSLNDQIFIKAKRLRNIEEKKIKKIDENSSEDLKGIINYGLIALIQIRKELLKKTKLSIQESITFYEEGILKVKELMIKKNHDYGEVWREMRKNSITDMILQKILRLRQIDNKKNNSFILEKSEEHYMDIINYAIFRLILEN